MKTPRCCAVPRISCLKGETRQIDELAPQELNKFLSEFLITVRKKEDNREYEPNSLRAFFASLERYLKKKNYGLCLLKDVQFEQTRKALQSKQRDLKRKGKGNKPNASAALASKIFKFCMKRISWEVPLQKRFKHDVVQQHNPLRVTRLQGAQRNVLGRRKTLSNFHRAGVP